jgi:hypothetical protein
MLYVIRPHIRYVQLNRETNQENIKKLGVGTSYVTYLSFRAILKAVRRIFPKAKLQSCLPLIKCQVKNYLTFKTKRSQRIAANKRT